jgi:hypothetical protein
MRRTWSRTFAYRDKAVRAGDRAEWTVSVGGSAKPIRARIGAGLEPVVDEPSVRVMNVAGINGVFRNVACLELPASLFGRDQLKSGETIELASTLVTYGRAYRVEWKGRFTLRGN